MTKKELQNLRIGDIVVISIHGNNKGKRGTVDDIIRYECGGVVYLTPLDCEFTFYNPKTRCKDKNGLYQFRHESIQLDKPIVKKEFYMVPMLGKKPITWSADNFTSKELIVIDRFIKELIENASDVTLNDILIIDEDETF